MKFTRFSLDNPGAVFVITALVVLFGVVSLQSLPLQLLPGITQPQITIYNNWRSAAPQEVEEVINQPQEEMLRFNSGLESIVSNTSRGQGQITLNYQLGYDMSRALLDVINRLNQAPPLPLDAGEPFVASGGDGGLPGAASILVYANNGNSTEDMIVYQDLIEEVVEPRLARIPGVAQVNLNGQRPKEVAITLNPFKAAMLGISIQDIAQSLQRSRDVSGGFADVGRRRYTVRFLGEQDVNQLGELVIGWRGDQPVYLSEVATVAVDYAPNRGVSLRNGRPSYYISISRKNDANTVDLLDELNVALAELNAGPLQDENVTIELSFDASLHIRRAIELVQGNLLLGIVLATLVLFYFLRNVRATLVITLTIPVSVLVAFVALDLLQLTLNVISLAGLAFAVGLVMDAAIVVQENIFRLRQSGMNMRGAILEGCGQVTGALFSSTLTTVAIFVPILFMAGIEGQLFRDLAITLSVAVIASMVTALTVLPLITSAWLTKTVNEDHHRLLWDRLSDLVVRATSNTRRQVALIVGILGIATGAAWFLMPKVDFLPRADIDAISVFFNIPAGMNVATIENELAPEVVSRLAPYLDGDQGPGIRAYNFASFNGFFTQVYIYPEDPERVDELMTLLRTEVLAGIPDVGVFISRGSMINVDNGGGRGISVDIQGDDLESLLLAAQEGQRVIRELFDGGNVFARGGLSLDEPALNMVPKDRRLNASGMNRSEIANTVRAYTGGLFVGEYFDGNARMDMILQTDRWRSPEALLELPLATPQGGVQKVGDLVAVERSVGPTRLSRVDGRRTVSLTVQPPDSVTLEEALEILNEQATPAIKALLPEGSAVKYRGSADRLKQALSEMFLNFSLALGILLLIMAALFRSLRDSVVVLLVMPVALAGGLAGLAVLNLFTYQSLDMLTMIGFIILLGLVVNNAILLVDQTRRGERDGLCLGDAVGQAVRYRARPIFMSSLTSIFGMLPLMLVPGVGSEIYRGLATVIVGGMILSALFTLMLLPSLLRLNLPSLRLPASFGLILKEGS